MRTLPIAAVQAFWSELEEIEKVSGVLGSIRAAEKVPGAPQVARALSLKPLAGASSAIRVPGAAAAKAGTATNLTQLKAGNAIYG